MRLRGVAAAAEEKKRVGSLPPPYNHQISDIHTIAVSHTYIKTTYIVSLVFALVS